MQILPYLETQRLTRAIRFRARNSKTKKEKRYWTRLLIQVAFMSNTAYMFSEDPKSGLLSPWQYHMLRRRMNKQEDSLIQTLASMYQRS